ncbi:hypothetical protein FIC_01272 [Flavobacteriaceae bacterium 3519-10]|nr:hypothetical protein FIC_01272 [Flavobacteriaceae bacterium 3519-10]
MNEVFFCALFYREIFLHDKIMPKFKKLFST